MRKAGQGNNLARLKILILKVLSNDFADVDVCEELCYHSLPKKQNSEGYATKEGNGRVIGRRESVTR